MGDTLGSTLGPLRHALPSASCALGPLASPLHPRLSSPLINISPAAAPLRRPWRTRFQTRGRPSSSRLNGKPSLPGGSALALPFRPGVGGMWRREASGKRGAMPPRLKLVAGPWPGGRRGPFAATRSSLRLRALPRGRNEAPPGTGGPSAGPGTLGTAARLAAGARTEKAEGT